MLNGGGDNRKHFKLKTDRFFIRSYRLLSFFSTTDEFSDDEDKKLQLLTGKRVTLAEELSKCDVVLKEIVGRV